MSGPGLLCVDVELLGLTCRLCASPGDDGDVLKAMDIEGVPRQTDGTFTLFVRKVLRFSVRSLDNNPGDGSLHSRSH